MKGKICYFWLDVINLYPLNQITPFSLHSSDLVHKGMKT
jgi:hypothetical protein